MPDGPWSEFQQSTPQAPPPDASGPWSQYAAPQGTPDTETHRIRDFFGNLGKSLNPMPALNAAEDRQNQETAQFHQQLNDKQYTEALKTFVRSVPGADTIRAEGQNTIDSLKKAYQDYTRDQQNGGQAGAAFKDAVSAIPFIGRPTVAAGEQWDRGDRAGALGSALPIVAPTLAGPAIDLASATARGLPEAATAVKNTASNVKPALAQTIINNPNATRAVAAMGVGLPAALIGREISPWGAFGMGTAVGGLGGEAMVRWARESQLSKIGETLKDVPDDVLIAAQKNPPIQLQQQVKGVVGVTGVVPATKDLIRTELARRQQATGAPIFGSSQPPIPMASNPQITLGQDLTTSGLPNAYPVPGKRSAGVEPAPPAAPSAPYPVVGRSASVKSASGSPYGDITGTLGTPVPPTPEATSYPVVGRSASIKSAAGTPYAGTNGTVGTPAPPSVTPSPIPTAGRSASQTGLGIPIGDPYSGTTGSVNPITALRQDMGVPANPVGPSPQLMKDIAKVGGNPAGAHRILQDMIAKGETDPYTGNPLAPPAPPVAPPPVSAPTAPTPAPVANPVAALKTPEPAQAPATPSPDFVPPTSTVVEHTWISPDGTKQPVKLMSEEGLGKYATDNGLDPDEAEAYLKQNGYAIDDRKQLMKSLMFHAEDLGYDRQAVYDMFRKDFGIRKVDNANSEQILKTYQKMLDTPGPMTSQATGYVDLRKGNAAPQPVNLPPKAFSALPQVPGTQGPSLEDLLGRSLPPQP